MTFDSIPIPNFKPRPLPVNPSGFTFSRVRDLAFNDLVNSFRVPRALLRADDEADYSSRHIHELRRDIMDQKLQKLSDELLGSMLGGPAGHLALESICTTPAASQEATKNLTFQKLRETLSKLSKPSGPGPAVYKLHSCNLMAERRQFRFPKSKKKRIRRKWAKRTENYRYEPMKHYYIIEDTIYAHPTVIAKIKEALPCTLSTLCDIK